MTADHEENRLRSVLPRVRARREDPGSPPLQVPGNVVALLEQVRVSGVTNMLDVEGVLAAMSPLLVEPEDYAAWLWLVDHREGYVQVLRELGVKNRYSRGDDEGLVGDAGAVEAPTR